MKEVEAHRVSGLQELHQPKRVLVYLTPGFSLLSFSSVVEALSLANIVSARETYQWSVVSNCGQAVMSGCAVEIGAVSSLAEVRRYSFEADRPAIAVIIAGNQVEKYTSKALDAWIREMFRRKTVIAAVGTAPMLLASAGLLDRRKCTVHWEQLPSLVEHYPHAAASASVYHFDGGIWTCGGGTAALDMMLAFIERDLGEETMVAICEQALVERVRLEKERQRVPMCHRNGVVSETVMSIVESMEQHLTEPLTVAELSNSVRRSRRQIERLFSEQLGKSPVQYYRELRLERAQLLLAQSAMTILDIAVLCGFVSASHFSRCYKTVYGVTPQEDRRIIHRRPLATAKMRGTSQTRVAV